MTATQLAANLRTGTISAVEVCAAAIARIEALDGQINAVIVRDFERASADARKADEALGRGDAGALLGVPMTVKESFDLKGHPTTWGFGAHVERRAREDALAVQRLKAAGAVILGKTNVPPALGDWQAVNVIYGRTSNPYDLSRSPGGSSGGGAAALAMGFSALELGSDIGGSVRIPAAFCGVFGLKASHGIIPMGGHAPGGAVMAHPELSVLGPMARSAEDLELALGVVAGPDADYSANGLVLPAPRHERFSSYRVFVLDRHPAAGVDGEIVQAIDDVADLLVREGASVARASNLLPDLQASWRTYQSLLHTITSRRTPNGRPPISAHDWMGHLDDQLRIRHQWSEFFRHFDVVIAPSFGTVAFPHTDEPDWRKRELIIDGEATPYGAQLGWASIATVANLPSTAAPMGLNTDGLPLSVQVIGPFLEDLMTIAFAGMIARPAPPPALAVSR